MQIAQPIARAARAPFRAAPPPSPDSSMRNKEFSRRREGESIFPSSRKWVRCKRTQLRANSPRHGGGEKGRDSSAIPRLTNSRRSRERGEADRGKNTGNEREREREREQKGNGEKKEDREGKTGDIDGGKDAKGGVRALFLSSVVARRDERWKENSSEGWQGSLRLRLPTCLPTYLPPGSPVSIDSTPPTCWLSSP